ncbi:MAG: ABC transporter permease [Acidobacteria bacterium]|nr:ABC transporter permease [Acidobacteriota bacterium]
MKFPDILRLAIRNLRESRLRASLTTIGVVVGVAVIVTMVSFGLGLQRNAVQRFKDLDLFNEITVSGRSIESLVANALAGQGRGRADKNGNGNRAPDERPRSNLRGDRDMARVLDDAAVQEIAQIPGVAGVEPSVTFVSYVRANGRVQTRPVGGTLVPNASTRFRTLSAGRMISSPEAAEAIVDEVFLKTFGFEKPGDAVGQTIEVLSQTGPGGAKGQPGEGAGPGAGGETKNGGESAGEGGETKDGADKLRGDESADDEPMSFFGMPLEAESEGEGDFSGLAGRKFEIVGVLKVEAEGGEGRGPRFRGFTPAASIYVPLPAARAWARANANSLSQVAMMLARARGVLKEGESEGYPTAVVRVTDPDILIGVQKEINRRGFSAFSIVDQLEEIRTVFLILNSALGLLGGISLLVASFGIANTMIMSILERTREIGIMKAIGAEDGEIKLIFFVEAALIGLTGGVVGSLAAWGIAAAANRIAFRFFLQPRGVAYVSFFDLPPYLWLGAILFAVLVSIAAALYPAARAARIDPVKALRHD